MERADFPTGPWDSEPDREEFEHAGLPCLLSRSDTSGAWCGYAAVPPGHPLHGKKYTDADVEVHGGLTYADKCSGSICHVPKPGEPDDVWWFGFDCAHAWDRTPMMELMAQRIPSLHRYRGEYFHEKYRDIEYAREETKKLAEQLAELKGNK